MRGQSNKGEPQQNNNRPVYLVAVLVADGAHPHDTCIPQFLPPAALSLLFVIGIVVHYVLPSSFQHPYRSN